MTLLVPLAAAVAAAAVPGFLVVRTLFRWACVHYRHS